MQNKKQPNGAPNAAPNGAPAGGPPMGKPKMNFSVLGRILKYLFRSYPVLMPITCVCILISAGVSSIPAIFTQKVLAVITTYLDSGNVNFDEAWGEIWPLIAVLASLYVLSLIFITIHTQLMAYITQGFLDKMRCLMFERMQSLPIRYFDTHRHGDVMSHTPTT